MNEIAVDCIKIGYNKLTTNVLTYKF